MSATTQLRRLWSLVTRGGAPGGGAAPATPAWPHLTQGWLDPNVPLSAWRITVDPDDLRDVLQVIASASRGRLGDAEVAEVIDVVAQTEAERTRAFRFGDRRAFTQVWIGVVPSAAGRVKLFLLANSGLIEDAQVALSVGGFSSAEKRAEYDLLRRFFIAGWRWQWTDGPWGRELQSGSRDLDPLRALEGMERILGDPASPFLDVLRGLRKRALEILDGTSDLDGAAIEAADAHLSAQGAPTITQMRLRYAPRAGDPSPDAAPS